MRKRTKRKSKRKIKKVKYNMNGSGLKKLFGKLKKTVKNIGSNIMDKDSELRNNIKENVLLSIG